MTIVDCFSFHNEIELFRLRLRLLAPVVDEFWVIEACQTHSGLPKIPILKTLLANGELGLDEVIQQKLQVHTIEAFPGDLDHWGRERHQRDIAIQCVESRRHSGSSPHLLVCDLDEIPSPGFLKKFRNNASQMRLTPITMWQCYFRPNFVRIKGDEREWSGPFIAPLDLIRSQRSLSQFRELARQRHQFERVPSGRFQGWHLSYQGNEVFINQKRKAFAHQEERVQKASIQVESLIQERRGPFDDSDDGSQWAVLPLGALGMPDSMISDPFIKDRVLFETDNVGQILLTESPEKTSSWSLRRLLGLQS
jgi:hypothetical protein